MYRRILIEIYKIFNKHNNKIRNKIYRKIIILKTHKTIKFKRLKVMTQNNQHKIII